MSKKVKLMRWAEQHYDPPPSISTLRKWRKAHCIQPEPEFVGREYRVDPNAKYVPPGSPLTVVHPEADDVVASIWNSPQA